MKLIIIDVQHSYIEFIMATGILETIPVLAEQYSEIYYIWDNISGQDLEDEIPVEWNDKYEYDEDGNEIIKDVFYDKITNTIEKQYGFIRDLMDEGHSKDDLILLGKFLLNNNMNDARDFYENDDVYEKFKDKFKNSALVNIDFNSLVFNLPSDLIEELNQIGSCSLVGGGRKECLEEVSILLDILDIPHTILEEYCY